MRWVAFLRAINTGNRRVTGDRLTAIFEALGFDDVSSFQASGNVLFTADRPFRSDIEAALEVGLGYPVPTALRHRGDIDRVVADSPFTESELAETEGRVQVMFLLNPPEAVEVRSADVPAEDLLVLRAAEAFWLPRAGISTSNLSPPALERTLGPLTIRTLGTVERISARL